MYILTTIQPIPLWCLALTAAITALALLLTRKWAAGLLAGGCLLILAETVLLRIPFGGQHFQPQSFWSYRVWEQEKYQILANVLAFIPIGILGARRRRWRTVPMAAAFSATIEFLQLITHRGLFEFDDIIHNTAGTVLGCVVFIWIRGWGAGQSTIPGAKPLDH